MIDKLFDGSADMLFASLLDSKNISGKMIEKLKALVGESGNPRQRSECSDFDRGKSQ